MRYDITDFMFAICGTALFITYSLIVAQWAPMLVAGSLLFAALSQYAAQASDVKAAWIGHTVCAVISMVFAVIGLIAYFF